jgi:hypothetical protein
VSGVPDVGPLDWPTSSRTTRAGTPALSSTCEFAVNPALGSIGMLNALGLDVIRHAETHQASVLVSSGTGAHKS